MRFVALVLVPLAALAAAVGCSSSSSSGSPATGDDGGATGDGGANGSLVDASFHMQATVPAGGEMFKCKYVQLPDVDGFMVGGSHDYTPGSHHMLLFTTDLTSIPAGGDQVTDCYETTSGSMMSHVRGVLYGGQTPTGNEQYPPGVGLKTNASQVLLFQVHYLNAGATDLAATVNADITIETNSANISTYAGILFFYDPFIDVPAGATAKAVMRCPIPNDITLMYASSHYHARGVGYSAWLDDATGTLGTTAFYTSSSWSSPDNAHLTMPIKAGSRLRFECDYDNSAGTLEYYAGQSAQTNEMCMFVGAYYPAMGQLDDYCFQNQDMFGTGPATCATTLSCFQACTASGKGSAGSGGGTPVEIDFSDCEQKCMVQSCPTASGPLITFTQCLKSSCSNECADASSSACSSCVASKCANEYTSCQSQACP